MPTTDNYPVRCAIYARVSTADQNCELQVRELRVYCQHRGWDVIGEYIDTGVSGAKDSRPELDKLMRSARRREFDVCVVWRFDRFARSVKHLVLALEEFQSLGIGFVSFQEALDTSTPMGKAMFTIIGAMAELERNVIRERVRAGGEMLGGTENNWVGNEWCSTVAGFKSFETAVPQFGRSQPPSVSVEELSRDSWHKIPSRTVSDTPLKIRDRRSRIFWPTEK